MDERQPPAHHVTLFWAAVWLIAVCVIGILAGVAFYRYEVVDVDAGSRLLSILVIGEVLLYFIVLLIPGERVVPPGRTILAVFLAMAVRAGMAVAASQIVIARYAADAGLAETWVKFYSTFWPAAVMQIGLIAVYLWLIRAALETPRPAPERDTGGRDFAEHLEQFRVPAPPDDEEARQRQEELLSALMEEPDEPVQWPAEVIAQAQRDRVKEEAEPEQGPPSEVAAETDEGESTDTMPPVPGLQAEQVEAEEPAPQAPEPEGEEPPEEPEVETAGVEPETEGEPTPSEEEVAEELIPPVAEAETEPAEPPVRAETPEQPSLPMEEEAEEEQQPVQRAPMSADITSEQASMIEGAVSDLPDMPLTIAVSLSERIYALLGAVFSESDEADLTGALDALYATHRLVGDALHYGVPRSLSITADEGALILGASEQGGAGVALYNPGEEKIGRVNLLARKVASAAADMPLDNPYDPGLSPATHCTPDADRTATLQSASGTDDLQAYTCEEYEIAIAGPVAHPENLAPAAAALVMASEEVLQMLPAGNASRMLAEYTGGGAVIASCGEEPSLVVTATGADGTMGAANVRARTICRVIEEG